MSNQTLADLLTQRDELDAAIEAEQQRQNAEHPPGWAAFLLARIGDAELAPDRRKIIYSDRQSIEGQRTLYACDYCVMLDGRSGPRLREVLAAVLALEEARERGEIEDEVAQ